MWWKSACIVKPKDLTLYILVILCILLEADLMVADLMGKLSPIELLELFLTSSFNPEGPRSSHCGQYSRDRDSRSRVFFSMWGFAETWEALKNWLQKEKEENLFLLSTTTSSITSCFRLSNCFVLFYLIGMTRGERFISQPACWFSVNYSEIGSISY